MDHVARAEGTTSTSAGESNDGNRGVGGCRNRVRAAPEPPTCHITEWTDDFDTCADLNYALSSQGYCCLVILGEEVDAWFEDVLECSKDAFSARRPEPDAEGRMKSLTWEDQGENHERNQAL